MEQSLNLKGAEILSTKSLKSFSFGYLKKKKKKFCARKSNFYTLKNFGLAIVVGSEADSLMATATSIVRSPAALLSAKVSVCDHKPTPTVQISPFPLKRSRFTALSSSLHDNNNDDDNNNNNNNVISHPSMKILLFAFFFLNKINFENLGGLFFHFLQSLFLHPSS